MFDEELTVASGFVGNYVLTLKTGALFLSLALWNWSVRVISNNSGFFNSQQFRIYVDIQYSLWLCIRFSNSRIISLGTKLCQRLRRNFVTILK